jgi:hypothetical protein
MAKSLPPVLNRARGRYWCDRYLEFGLFRRFYLGIGPIILFGHIANGRRCHYSSSNHRRPPAAHNSNISRNTWLGLASTGFVFVGS